MPRLRHLNETLFVSLGHARSALRLWRDDYNHVRPHSGVGWLTPADFTTGPRQVHEDTEAKLPVAWKRGAGHRQCSERRIRVI